MRPSSLIFAVFALLFSCDSEEPVKEFDLNARSGGTIWKQVAFRYPATGEFIPVADTQALQIRFSGEDVLMVADSTRCTGKIADSTMSFDFSCSYISPVWFIVERTEDRMYIYPRLGAMYHYDYVLEKVESAECLVPSRCDLKPEVGPCKALFTKYFFDQAEGKCKEFSWGGCDGVVPFNTLEECKACECNGNANDK